MIVSYKHNFCIISPPRTATKSRFIQYKSINETSTGLGFHTTVEEFKNHRAYKQNKHSKIYCFVRNPWKRAVSMYNHMHIYKTREQKLQMFRSCIMAYHMKPMHHFYCDKNNNMVVDKLLTYENISNELENIHNTHDIKNITFSVKPPKKYPDYDNLWTQQMIDRVYEKEYMTIDLMGYTF